VTIFTLSKLRHWTLAGENSVSGQASVSLGVISNQILSIGQLQPDAVN
jgi:hypothetical protein